MIHRENGDGLKHNGGAPLKQLEMDAMTDEIRSLRDQLDKMRMENEALRAAAAAGSTSIPVGKGVERRPSLLVMKGVGSEKSIELSFRRSSIKKRGSIETLGLDSCAGMDSCAGIFGDFSDSDMGSKTKENDFTATVTTQQSEGKNRRSDPSAPYPETKFSTDEPDDVVQPRSAAIAFALKATEKKSKNKNWQNDDTESKNMQGKKVSSNQYLNSSRPMPVNASTIDTADVDAALKRFSNVAKDPQYGYKIKGADGPVDYKSNQTGFSDQIAGEGKNSHTDSDDDRPRHVPIVDNDSNVRRPRFVPPVYDYSDDDRPQSNQPPHDGDDSSHSQPGQLGQSMTSFCSADMAEALKAFSHHVTNSPTEEKPKEIETAAPIQRSSATERPPGRKQRRSSLAGCRSTTFTYEDLHQQQKEKMNQVGALSANAGVFVHPDANKMNDMNQKRRTSSITSAMVAIDEVAAVSAGGERNNIRQDIGYGAAADFSANNYEVEKGNGNLVHIGTGMDGGQSQAMKRSSVHQRASRRGSVRLVTADMLKDGVLQPDPSFQQQEKKQEVAPPKKAKATGKSFEQFLILSVRPETLIKDKELIMDEHRFIDDGPRYLDSFILENSATLDMFPSKQWSIPIDRATLSSFCFPNGVKVRVIPKAALKGAKRLGWAGKENDQHHLLVFTNETHENTYGIAITIHEEIVMPCMSSNSDCALRRRFQRRRAAVVLCRWWRRTITHHRIWNSIHGDGRRSSCNSDISTRSEEIYSTHKNKKFHRTMSMRTGVKKVLRGGRKKKKKVDDGVDISMHSMTESTFQDFSSHSMVPLHGDALTGISNISEHDLGEFSETERLRFHARRQKIAASRKPEGKRTTQKEKFAWARKKAIESHKAMIESEQLGNICLVEKCYVIVGVREQEQVILLAALQKLVDHERKMNLEASDGDLSSPKKKGKIPKSKFDQILFRHNNLACMQSELLLSEEESQITFPRSQVDMAHSKRRFFENVLPIPESLPLKLPLPLPQMGDEWGFAQLLLTIGPDSLMLALKLLLLERPIFVLGESLQTVTSCACALVGLLKPYQWESTFMPILPYSMLDFINSPVPFVAGMAVDGPHRVSIIENDDRTMQAMAEGMSLINLTTGSLMITSEEGIAKMLKVPFYVRETMTSLYFRLKMHQSNVSSALRSCTKFMNHGFSLKERVTLHSTRLVIENHFRDLAGDIASNISGWKQYGKNDAESDIFDFYPSWFMKARHEELKYQQALVHTQLFVGYVDSRRNVDLEREKLRHSEAGKKIANWLIKKWKENKRR